MYVYIYIYMYTVIFITFYLLCYIDIIGPLQLLRPPLQPQDDPDVGGPGSAR